MDKQMMLQFGIGLKRLRKEKKLSQSRMGQAVGVHYNRIGKYEMGASYPSVPVLIKLSALLEVSMDDLIRGSAVSGRTVQTDSGEVSPSSSSSTASADDHLAMLVRKVNTLPPDDQNIVAALLEAFLSRRAISDLIALGREESSGTATCTR